MVSAHPIAGRARRGRLIALAATLAAVTACAADDASAPAGPRLDELQAKGTHNSYHTFEGDRALIPELDYRFDPLATQLGEQGVRQLELDVHLQRSSGVFEVYHVPLVDEGTTCRRFTDCLGQILAWSDSQGGGHVPVFVFIEPKDDAAQVAAELDNPDGVDELLLAGHVAEIDDAILAVIPRDRLITPDDVRGDHATLAEAVATGAAWPRLDAARGRFAFVLLDQASAREEYRRGDAHDLSGRVMFVAGEPGDPDAAVAILDDPVRDADAIAAAVAAHLIVRTRADAEEGPEPARAAAAMALGAHFISTDYARPDPDRGDGYVFDLGGAAPVRCNPISATAACDAAALEAP
ncbi:MAG: hypothetical protein H6745_13485 [Deltaproteobacteria bacterium]|nr:hypothetical protein [Deltaproteobacteria bacterium]